MHSGWPWRQSETLPLANDLCCKPSGANWLPIQMIAAACGCNGRMTPHSTHSFTFIRTRCTSMIISAGARSPFIQATDSCCTVNCHVTTRNSKMQCKGKVDKPLHNITETHLLKSNAVISKRVDENMQQNKSSLNYIHFLYKEYIHKLQRWSTVSMATIAIPQHCLPRISLYARLAQLRYCSWSLTICRQQHPTLGSQANRRIENKRVNKLLAIPDTLSVVKLIDT